MLSSVGVRKGSSSVLPVQEESEIDSGLVRILGVIVHDFNGSTSAFFDSIQPDFSGQAKEREEKESRVVGRFIKSV
ncbi:MAG: hypothetical protein ACP5I8_15930 [Phycisphaerae bacterium]